MTPTITVVPKDAPIFVAAKHQVYLHHYTQNCQDCFCAVDVAFYSYSSHPDPALSKKASKLFSKHRCKKHETFKGLT